MEYRIFEGFFFFWWGGKKVNTFNNTGVQFICWRFVLPIFLSVYSLQTSGPAAENQSCTVE